MLVGASYYRPSGSPAVPPGLLDASGLPVVLTTKTLRRVTNTYTGAACRVRRASDNSQTDIGFLANGDFDMSAVAGFGAGTTVYIVRIYNQGAGGGAYDWVQPNPSQQRIIYENGAVVTKNGKVATRAPDGTRGYICGPFAPITGTNVTACFVGAISSHVSSLTTRILSLLPTNTSLNDGDVSGAVLLARDGGATPTQHWAIQRSTHTQVTATGVYGQLSQVSSRISGSLYGLVVDGTETVATGTTGNNLGYSRLTSGFTGSQYVSAQDDYESELLVFATTLTTGQLKTVRTNQQAYYATPADVAPPSTSPTSGLTLKAHLDFTSGSLPSTAVMTYYDNAPMTKLNGVIPGVWKKSCISVSGGKLINSSQTITTPVTLSGASYTYIGGGFYWKPPEAQIGGYYETYGRSDGGGKGHGTADLLYPLSQTYGGQWPRFGEFDIRELPPTNSSHHGGSANMHWDTTINSGRHWPINFPGGTDWTTWHKMGLLWIPGKRLAIYLDDALVGDTPASYIPPVANSVLMRCWGAQREGYGVTPAQRTTGTFNDEYQYFNYYALS